MEQIMRDTYEGKLKPGQLSQTHIRETYNELNKGAKEGYGKNWTQVNNQDGIPKDVLKIQQNIWKFSGAKDAAMLEEINRLMTRNGQKTNWEDFKAEVLKLNDKYNVQYLQAEWQTARQAGNHASNWEQYQKRKHLYPNLKYKTQGDKNVRDAHRKLDGIIAPIDGSFWRSFYPPNGWRCRCYVVQTAEDATKDIPTISDSEVKPEFKVNVGSTGQIFKENTDNNGNPHPYFDFVTNHSQALKDALERTKANCPYTVAYQSDNGTKFYVSPFTDPSDYQKNFAGSKTFADSLNLQINIREHLNIEGEKNPEYEYIFDANKIIKGDRVSPTSKNVSTATNNAFKGKLSEAKNGQLSDQENCFIAIELWFEPTNKNIEDFTRQSWSKFNQYESLDFVIYYIEDVKALKITRGDLKKGYPEYLKTIADFIK
ncbi:MULTISPECIES: phage head morphogenesis protein [Empedobacter]|uniref:phage head morphogenesis protein n=1 Tax=Empedobacter TaxID=59734 RepID=UPI002574C78B|nr:MULTISPECIES: phage minor head protein [Empedobacter]MDM1042144.1 minor capsid protein [Empedobacter brevis]MDM1135982.1 minor capsid protein [Empedobacter sp. R750]